MPRPTYIELCAATGFASRAYDKMIHDNQMILMIIVMIIGYIAIVMLYRLFA